MRAENAKDFRFSLENFIRAIIHKGNYPEDKALVKECDAVLKVASEEMLSINHDNRPVRFR